VLASARQAGLQLAHSPVIRLLAPWPAAWLVARPVLSHRQMKSVPDPRRSATDCSRYDAEAAQVNDAPVNGKKSEATSHALLQVVGSDETLAPSKP
jgi:hypothetical protein